MTAGGFWQAPRRLRRLLELRKLTPSAWSLLLYFGLSGADRPEGFVTTRAHLEDVLGVQRSTVYRALKECRDVGVCTIDLRPGQKRPFTVRLAGDALLDESQQKLDVEPPVAPGDVAELWDAIEAAGIKAPTAKSPRASFAKIVRELAAAGRTAEDIPRLAAAYRRHPTLGQTLLTLPALAKWADQLDTRKAPAPPCPSCGVGGGQHAADCEFITEKKED